MDELTFNFSVGYACGIGEWPNLSGYSCSNPGTGAESQAPWAPNLCGRISIGRLGVVLRFGAAICQKEMGRIGAEKSTGNDTRGSGGPAAGHDAQAARPLQ